MAHVNVHLINSGSALRQPAFEVRVLSRHDHRGRGAPISEPENIRLWGAVDDGWVTLDHATMPAGSRPGSAQPEEMCVTRRISGSHEAEGPHVKSTAASARSAAIDCPKR